MARERSSNVFWKDKKTWRTYLLAMVIKHFRSDAWVSNAGCYVATMRI